MKRTLTKVIDFFRIVPASGWSTIDLDLTLEDLMEDLDPGWSDWDAAADSRPARTIAA
jgi:hypothetical protein